VKIRIILGAVLIASAAFPARAGEKVCLGSSWGKLSQQQKSAFVNEFKNNGGQGDPSSCARPNGRVLESAPQPAKAATCVQQCTSDQALVTAMCSLTALFNPSLAASCTTVNPQFGTACQATCTAKYGAAS